MGERYRPENFGRLSQSERWNSEAFHSYMLKVAKYGKEGLEQIDNFPKRIELNGMWHDVLNKMRAETKDGYERWTPIGYKEDMSNLSIPTEFFVGERNEIPEFKEDQIEEFTQKYSELGLVHFAGDFHSHPRRSVKSYLRSFIISGRFLTEYSGFSPRDLKRIIELSPSTFPFHMFGLVDEKANCFAFITKQIETISADSPLQDDSEFSYYWFNRYAPSVIEHFPPVTSTLWDINIGIAEKYKLALYRGEVQEDLVRSFP
jgi:hypothetical protein